MVSLVLTLSHELQHFGQYTQESRSLYVADAILSRLLGAYNGIHSDASPSEQDALRKSKRVATGIFGDECVRAYAEAQTEGGDAALFPLSFCCGII
jgi:hypothetical protein